MSVFERVTKWEIRLVFEADKLCTYSEAVINSKTIREIALKPRSPGGEGSRSYLIYRTEILRLLAYPKSAHDQLFFELPCRQGFRSKEVTTLRIEHVDFVHESMMVFDAKKHVLLGPIPLDRQVATHIMECSHGRSEGLVVENESPVWRGRQEPLSNVAVWYKWRKYAQALNLYPSPREYSPIVGRRFYIAETLWVRKDEPLLFVIMDLMRIVRHGDWRYLLDYAQGIRFEEDVRQGFDRVQNAMEEALENFQPVKVKA